MTSAPAAPARIEPDSSQKRPILAFIRHLGIRQQSVSQRFRRAGQDPSKTEISATSRPHLSNAGHGGGEPRVWSWVDVADELTAENDGNLSPTIDVDKRVASTSRRTADGTEQLDVRVAQTGHEPERPATFKSHSSVAGAVNIEEEIFSNRAREKIQHERAATISHFRLPVSRFKRRYLRAYEPLITKPDEVDSSVAVQRSEGNQPTSANDENTVPAASESEEIERLKQALSESHSLIAELQQRLEAQSKHLESSNNFLNTADKFSDSDVIRALQRLNAEVQQNSTYIADCLVDDFEFENRTANLTKEQSAAVKRVSRRLGGVLVKSFAASTPDNVPLLLLAALQAYFASVLCQAASCWAFEAGNDKFIRDVYQKLRRAETQAISGRWRSLTRAHNVHSWIKHTESLLRGIVTDIADIMLAAGCTALRSDIITKVSSKFKEKISSLVDLAAGLNRMFDEVVSSDFELFIPWPGDKFNSGTMDDADDSEVGIEDASVLCATHIGLTKRVPLGTLWEKGKKKIIVLKAKVLLESFLNTGLEG